MPESRPTPVVFLHSAGQTPQMWQSQVEAVAAAAGPGAEVQTIAPWLAGLRPGRPGELSLSAASGDVISQLDRYGMKSARLVGHQLGAMVALQIAAETPERVASLVLSGAFVAPGRVALAMQKSLIRLLPNQALAESGATKADLLRALDLIAGADFGSRLSKIAAEALIIAGSADPALAAAKQLAERLPNARLAQLPGVGPNPSLEAPEEYNRLLVGSGDKQV